MGPEPPWPSIYEPGPLLFRERNDREPADDDQWRVGEERLGLDGGEGLGRFDALACFDLDDGNLGIGGVHADNGPGADRGALVAGVVEDPLGASLHFTQIFDSGGVGDAIPDGFLVAEEVVEGIGIGLGLEQEVGHRSIVRQERSVGKWTGNLGLYYVGATMACLAETLAEPEAWISEEYQARRAN